MDVHNAPLSVRAFRIDYYVTGGQVNLGGIMGKRWSAWSKGLILGTALMVVLAACGSDPTATPRPTATSVPVPTPTLAPGVTPPPATATPVPTPTPSFDAAAYFKGKTIRVVANSNPGGGTDAQGRVMSAFMSKWIPGNPRIVFANKGNKPLAYVFAATEAPKDGTYIAWDSTPQLNMGFEEPTNFIKRSTFEFLGATIDSNRAWTTYDPIGNLGPDANDKCLWDYAGMGAAGTGGGAHQKFIIPEEISDVAEGAPQFVANSYVGEQLNIPFQYFPVDTADTNAVLTMWARGDANTTVRNSLWYRFPLEQPNWLPNGLVRMEANMGPGQLKANAWGEPHCGAIVDHLEGEVLDTFKAIMNPPNYMSKALWLPPGTPTEIADALSIAFQNAFEQDEAMLTKYGAIAGETPQFTDRATGTAATKENEDLFETSIEVTAREAARLIQKYFPEYVSN